MCTVLIVLSCADRRRTRSFNDATSRPAPGSESATDLNSVDRGASVGGASQPEDPQTSAGYTARCLAHQATGIRRARPSTQVGSLARCTPKPRITQNRRRADAEAGERIRRKETKEIPKEKKLEKRGAKTEEEQHKDVKNKQEQGKGAAANQVVWGRE